MTWVDSTDGLISSQKGVFSVVTFADCIPTLFLDKRKKIVGVVHTGWKGVYKEIVKVLLSKMINKGCDQKEIIVGIGPSIKVCCYNIGRERQEAFEKKFPSSRNTIKRKNGKIFLDLAALVIYQLSECGILKKNILDCKLCTKDNISDFYSYRGEHGKSSFGLSAAVIGRI